MQDFAYKKSAQSNLQGSNANSNRNKCIESYSFYWLLFHMSRSHHKSGQLNGDCQEHFVPDCGHFWGYDIWLKKWLSWWMTQGDYLPPHVDHSHVERPFYTLTLLSECSLVLGHSLTMDAPGDFKGAFHLSLPVGYVWGTFHPTFPQPFPSEFDCLCTYWVC